MNRQGIAAFGALGALVAASLGVVGCSGDDAKASRTATTTTAPPPMCAEVVAETAARLLGSALAKLAVAQGVAGKQYTGPPECAPDGDLEREIAAGIGRAAVLRSQAKVHTENAAKPAFAATKSRELASARALVLQALAVDAGDQSLRDLLQSLDNPEPPKVPTLIASARALADYGYQKEAQEQFVEALKAGDVPAGDYAGLENHRTPTEWLGDNWLMLLSVAIGFLILVWMWRNVGRRWRVRRPLYPWTPVITFDKEVGASAPDVAVMARARMHELADAHHISAAQVSGVPAAGIELPSLGDVEPHLKPLDALIKWLFRTDRLSVGVRFPEPPATGGCQEVIEMSDGKSSASVISKFPSTGKPELDVTMAASYTSAWVTLNALLMRPRLDRTRGDPRSTLEKIGTTSPAAFGSCLAGVDAYKANRFDVAATLFERACLADGRYLQARFDLAITRSYGDDVAVMTEAALEILGLLFEDMP